MDNRKFEFLLEQMRERILLLDGAMGSLLQNRCDCHEEHSGRLPELIMKENPDIIKDIHREYLKAGADIIETNSFNTNRFSLKDHGIEGESYSLAFMAAKLAKETVEEFMSNEPGTPRFVAGSIGPGKQMLSLAEPQSDFNFDSLTEAYRIQIEGLLDGGADIILFETVFDTLTLKAALYAVSETEEDRGVKIPVMVSATVSDASGRLLCGQSLEAFYVSVKRDNLISVGLNCGLGSEHVLPYLRRLSEIAETGVSVYPNAGLPDDEGCYTESPEIFAHNLEECLKDRLVNIVGGCCGTTPAHIKQLKRLVENYKPRPIPENRHRFTLSNLDIFEVIDEKGLIQVGERTNVAGSAKFARLMRDKNFDEAIEVAVRQINQGANVIDVCMDDALEDSVANMREYLKRLIVYSETSRVPVMIDSSDWNVIETALKLLPGKSIVNSISLKEGEEDFLNKAVKIKRLGAAVLVMLFDEEGQADTYSRKCEVAQRSYRLLQSIGFPEEDIIFDPNVLTVGTGLQSKDTVALDFIRATEWIRGNLPNVSVSGGISNLSFAFRGNNPLREAMHTVFIYHANRAGMNVAIVNPGKMMLYDEIERDLLEILEDVILCRSEEGLQKLMQYAEQGGKSRETAKEEGVDSVRQLTLPERFEEALGRGREKEMMELIDSTLATHDPMSIIEGFLMPAMKKVGEKFAVGKLFLPQVIKSAQTMRKGIERLAPELEKTNIGTEQEKIIIATVKGDVHDIGKNIVALVASCSGYDVEDLGVKVDEILIADRVEASNPKALLLSGLISPSLNEMAKVCQELERRGIKVPVIIGGAATSEIHTALRLAPLYSGPVFYSSDANANLNILKSLSEDFIEANGKRQDELRIKFEKSKQEKPEKVAPAVEKRDVEGQKILSTERRFVFQDFPISEIEKHIDWNWVAASLEMGSSDAVSSEQAEKLVADAKKMLETIKDKHLLKPEGLVEVFDARQSGNDILILRNVGEEIRLPMLRAERGENAGECIVDFLSVDKDSVALFAVSAGNGLKEYVDGLNAKGEVYNAILAKLIADRLAEAFAVWVNRKISADVWKIDLEKGDQTLRVAFGYPSSPDHSLKKDVFHILNVEGETGMALTETYMIEPSESVCGIILPRGKYINVGKIGKEQLKDYALKRNIKEEKIRELLPNNVE